MGEKEEKYTVDSKRFYKGFFAILATGAVLLGGLNLATKRDRDSQQRFFFGDNNKHSYSYSSGHLGEVETSKSYEEVYNIKGVDSVIREI